MKYRQTAYAPSLSFGSRASLLRFGVCRSSDFYIQLLLLLKLHQRTHFAFSPGHYSPSNDRLSPYAGLPAQKQYFVITATKEAGFANL